MPPIQHVEGSGSHLTSSFREGQQDKMEMHIHLLEKEVERDVAKENPRRRIEAC